MKEKARHIIEYATAQHEPYMLEEILRYEIVANMIKGKQIDLRRALNTALERRSARMSAWLLNEHTMDISNGFDRRPLEFAVKHSNIHTLMLFLAQPNFTFDKGTIEEGVALNLMLHKAYTEVSIDSLDQMLKRGARMRYEHFGMTALHVAAKIGRMPVMETLIDNLTEEEIQNDIDLTCSSSHKDQGRDGKTALAIAAMRGRFEMVGYLWSKGADIGVEDAQGKTAVDLAREAGWGDLMGILEEIEEGLGGEGSQGTRSEGRGREKKVWKSKGKMRADV
jgi:ankyrin repeat protein